MHCLFFNDPGERVVPVACCVGNLFWKVLTMEDIDEDCIAEAWAEKIFEEEEQDRINHEIDMTHDRYYRDWYLKLRRQREIEEFGIDED